MSRVIDKYLPVTYISTALFVSIPTAHNINLSENILPPNIWTYLQTLSTHTINIICHQLSTYYWEIFLKRRLLNLPNPMNLLMMRDDRKRKENTSFSWKLQNKKVIEYSNSNNDCNRVLLIMTWLGRRGNSKHSSKSIYFCSICVGTVLIKTIFVVFWEIFLRCLLSLKLCKNIWKTKSVSSNDHI